MANIEQPHPNRVAIIALSCAAMSLQRLDGRMKNIEVASNRRNFAVIKGLLIAMQAADGRGIATPAGLAAGQRRDRAAAQGRAAALARGVRLRMRLTPVCPKV